jgi:hypothetical protein
MFRECKATEKLPKYLFVEAFIKTQYIGTSTPLPCQKDLAKGKNKRSHVITKVKYFLVTWLKCKLVSFHWV